MKFCVIKNADGRFLGKRFDEGYYYSSYTQESASYGTHWVSLESILGEDRKSSFTIFENIEAAKEFINSKHSSYYDGEIITLDELEKE